MRDGNTSLLAEYDAFFTPSDLEMIDIASEVIERATDLRAHYRFKTPDAIHLATAIEQHADLFITGDVDLQRCSEIKVEVLRPD